MSKIWTPDNRIVLPPVGLRGSAKFVIKNMTDGRVRETDWNGNLITDWGMNNLYSTSAWGRYCHVGTGSTPPTVADPTLDSRFATVIQSPYSSSGANTGAPDYIASVTAGYTFAQNTFSDTILTEVALGPNSEGTNISTRTLITPPIQIAAIEELRVLYRLEVVVPQNTFNGSIQINDGDANPTLSYTGSVMSAASGSFISNNWPYFGLCDTSRYLDNIYPHRDVTSLGTIEQGLVGGSGLNNQNGSWGAFQNAPNRDLTVNYGIDQANAGNINGLECYTGMGSWKWFLTPGFSKDNTQTMRITVNVSATRV